MTRPGPILIAALWLAIPLSLASTELAEAAKPPAKPPAGKTGATAATAASGASAPSKITNGFQDFFAGLKDSGASNADGEDQVLVTKQRLSILDQRYQESVEFLTFERRVSLASGRIDRNFNGILKPILTAHFGRNFTDEELEGAKTSAADGAATKAARIPAYQYIHDYLEDFYLGNQLMLRPSSSNVFQAGLLTEVQRSVTMPDGTKVTRGPLLGDAAYGFGTFGYRQHHGPLAFTAEISAGVGVDTSLDNSGHIDGAHLRPLLMPGIAIESHTGGSINFSVLSFNILFEPAGPPLYFAGPSGWMLTLTGGPIFSF